jgi:hypothetical protein
MDNCIEIGRGDLKAWVAKPGERYSRARFDWTGFIPQISLRGHTFCAPEISVWRPEGSGGEGLCDEYRVDEETMAWSDEDRLFLKPGIGLLERGDDAPYHFGTDYKVVKPFPTATRAEADSISFHQDSIPLRGVAYAQDKNICVIDNMLVIVTTMTNTGEKPLVFHEYNHNFLSMDGLGAHPQVSLTLTKEYRNELDTPGLVMNEGGISFTDEIKSSFMIYCDDPIPYSPMRWELRDRKAGMYIQEWGDFDVSRFLAWGGPRVIAPEIYGEFPVEPGRSRTWTRLWKFYAE